MSMLTCKECGERFESKDPGRQLYCSPECYGKAKEIANPSHETARKRAGRDRPLDKCDICGTTKDLQRHHVGPYSKATKVRVLCQKCHTREHMKRGDWGRDGEQ